MIVPPIIIVGDGQVELFAGAASLEESLEAVDARLYRAYDSRGLALQIGAAFKEGSWPGIGWVENGAVSVKASVDADLHVDELRAALLDWWSGRSGSADASMWTLDQLVEAIARRDGVR